MVDVTQQKKKKRKTFLYQKLQTNLTLNCHDTYFKIIAIIKEKKRRKKPKASLHRPN